MGVDKLPPDATLADLAGLRTRRAEFVRRVVANFYASQVDRAKARVRIGVQGSGGRPNYRLETPTVIEPSGNPITLHAALIYNGANHETMTAFEADRVHESAWSTRTMTFKEAETLLGELREVGTS